MPRVSIGIPVYNGENFLEDAIRSVLAQTYQDLELVIADNASSDRTAEIGQDFAASDGRVRYLRNARNLGAAPNYNRVWEQSRGDLFKWLSHDDRILPGYVAATVAALDANPDAVLCNTVVDYIDDRGAIFAHYRSVLGEAGAGSPSQRFAAMVLRSHSCVDFFSMIRREAMVGSLLHASFHGADRAFLVQMALRGRLLQLPEPLVQMREHQSRYTRNKGDARTRRLWHDSSAKRTALMPTLYLYGQYLRMLQQESLSTAERQRCMLALGRWWFSNWNAMRVGTDVLSIAVPGTVGYAERVKNRMFGPAPGHFVR